MPTLRCRALAVWLCALIGQIIFLPAVLISRAMGASLAKARADALQQQPGWRPVVVPTEDGAAAVDAVLWEHPGRPARWLLFCNANGMCYEVFLSPLNPYVVVEGSLYLLSL